MQLRSTRSASPPVGADTALLAGLAPDGGLYVPVAFPKLDSALIGIGPGSAGPRGEDPHGEGPHGEGPRSYADIAFGTVAPWFGELPRAELRSAIERAAATFDDPRVAPLVLAGDLPVLELFHGPTLAFKDLALTLFGDLLAMARSQSGMKEELLVIVATSGDTGSAALSGLEGRDGVKVVALYPAKGVSEVQRRQMTTRSASNCLVLGIEGTFDDAQRTAKGLLSEPGPRRSFKEFGALPCSANSINVGRLAPQIAYYVHARRELASLGLLDEEGRFDVAVPSGNFGNVLAARYAKRMGLPISGFLVATNRNRVLADFLATGSYDRNRPFHVTTSPSMDILVSSNLERMLFEATGEDPSRTSALMSELATKGRYELTQGERRSFSDFRGASADDAEAAAEIRRVFEASGYLLDPHTATASAALRKSREGQAPLRKSKEGPAASAPPGGAGQRRNALLVATASPFKFAGTVAAALGLGTYRDEFDAIEALSERARLPVPRQLAGLRRAEERHLRVVAPGGVEAAIREWLSGAR